MRIKREKIILKKPKRETKYIIAGGAKNLIKNDVLSNNIANADTPGYKRKDVQFETYLSNAIAGRDSLDETVANIDLSTLESTTYTEQAGLSYRADGNNVDISTENVELAKNQLRYYTLMNSVNQEFNRLESALRTS